MQSSKFMDVRTLWVLLIKKTWCWWQKRFMFDWRQSRCHCLSGGCCRWCSQGWALFSANQKHLVFEMIWQHGFVGICHWWCTLKCLVRQVVLDPILAHHCLKEAWKVVSHRKAPLWIFLDLEALQVKVHAMSAKEWDVVAERRDLVTCATPKQVRPVCGCGVGHWRKAIGLICPWEDLDVFRYELERLELSCKFFKYRLQMTTDSAMKSWKHTHNLQLTERHFLEEWMLMSRVPNVQWTELLAN